MSRAATAGEWNRRYFTSAVKVTSAGAGES